MGGEGDLTEDCGWVKYLLTASGEWLLKGQMAASESGSTKFYAGEEPQRDGFGSTCVISSYGSCTAPHIYICILFFFSFGKI